MLNASEDVTPDALRVIDYVDPVTAHQMASGRMNTDEAQVLANIQGAVRRGYPQMRTWPMRPERICLVGSGPSVEDTLPELRQLIWEGASLVTLNGAYHWAISKNLRPNTQIVMDARPSNARFVEPAVPNCRYVLASQCDPAVWDAVEGRPDVWIFHAVVKQEGAASTFLDQFYSGNWLGVGGGTTVATRAISLLRMAGYLRFDLFGIDCCWRGDQHHVITQPENARDRRVRVSVSDRDHPETRRDFDCAPWHIKQFEDLLTMMSVNGQHFQLAAHGDGMFSYMLHTLGGDFSRADVHQVTLQGD